MEKLPCRWVCPKNVTGWGRGQQRFDGVAQSHHIFVLVHGGTVHELYAGQIADLHRALGQSAQPLQVVGSELIAGPQGGQAGDGIEVLQFHGAAGCLVMVAAHEDGPQAANPFDHVVGAGAVAHNIAEVHDQIVRRRRRQACFQSFEVAMNIAK